MVGFRAYGLLVVLITRPQIMAKSNNDDKKNQLDPMEGIMQTTDSCKRGMTRFLVDFNLVGLWNPLKNIGI